MNQETREALSFVIAEMAARLKKLYEQREAVLATFTDMDGEIGELQRRLEQIRQDMAAAD